MKKILFTLLILSLLGCAENKTFKKADGTEFVAQPYGWMTDGQKINGVSYQICKGNLVIDILLGETIVAPILLTGLELWEPISYTDPTNLEEKK